jgi:hypothetical protein
MLTLSDTRARYLAERDADSVTSGQVTASQTPEGTGPSVDICRGRREAPAGPATRTPGRSLDRGRSRRSTEAIPGHAERATCAD